MDPHPFSLACVRYLFVAILLKIKIKKNIKGSVDFNVRREENMI